MSEAGEDRIRELERIVAEQECRIADLSAAAQEKDSRISQLERAAAELQSSRKAVRFAARMILIAMRVQALRLLPPSLGVLRQYPPRPFVFPKDKLKPVLPVVPPKISIVTPSFNQGRYIERTIRSVIEQDYPNIEYMIQDGGSSDGTLDVLRKYSDSLAHWDSAKDGGQAHAINAGFRRATGSIMAYLNSDDILLPGTLAHVVSYFAAHPYIDVIYSHRLILDEEDREIGRWIYPPHDDEVLSWVDYLPQETLFWRRRIWDSVGGQLDESFQFAMDWDLLLRFRSAGARFARLPRFLAAFRVHPLQKTSAQLDDLGAREMDRLRRRCHGRTVTYIEITAATAPYLLHHVVYDRLSRATLLWR